MTPLQRAEELLEKITPGEWKTNCLSDQILSASEVLIADIYWHVPTSEKLMNADFIAASPALMRELVEECKSLEKELNYFNSSSVYSSIKEDRDKWYAELVQEKRKTLELTQQIEELKADLKENTYPHGE